VPFAAETFLGTAARLLSDAKDDADRRTVVGRAYYAVHGYFRQRLMTATGLGTRQLFGDRGRHQTFVNWLGRAPGLRHLEPQVSGLRRMRTRCDYEYEDMHSPDHARAKGAVDQARFVLESMGRQPDDIYRHPWPTPTP